MPRILIVEDSPDIRFIVREILKRRGYDTVEAENGVKALEILEQDARFDLMISDVRMAQMTGLELLDALQERKIRVPVIMLSVHTIPEWIDEAMQKGALTYLTKPFTPDQLIRTIEQYLVRT